jgi:hypothetical protein
VFTSGCASFTNVRSAQVKEGFAVSAHWSHSGDMGDDASYMWTGGQLDDCAPCSHSVSSLDVSFRKGIREAESARAYEFALGAAGISHIYAEAFVGWNQDSRLPFGIGARATLISGDAQDAGRDYRADGRLDLRLTDNVRVMLGSGVYYHRTSRGSWLLAYTPGAGLEASIGPISLSSSVGLLTGYGRRTDDAAADLGLQNVNVNVPVFAVGLALHGMGAVRPMRR